MAFSYGSFGSFVFNGQIWSSIAIIRDAKSWASTIKNNQKIVAPRNGVGNKGGHWNPPRAGTFKPNTDGGVNPMTMKPSSGGVIGDCRGDWIVGYTRNIGCCSILQSGFWGFLMASRLLGNEACSK
ncbi:uncharacterized protein LOC120205740 [Hibiscus syriacus]|uniref:uncharacterized protein LOC120205740 n=1 Tax=Hibiscus syriacus TaxID=106335 RepID=UPI001922CA1B|nr:uncharacterized protein LOC120205740 [Hibiscus syriacus]